MPENIRIYYSSSLLYDKKDNILNAEKTLLNGLKIDTNDESLPYVLAFHYSTAIQLEKARKTVIKLVQLYPNNPNYANFIKKLSL